jgi:hypothetical protein
VSSINLYGYYSGAHKDNAVMASNSSEAWASAHGYSEWGMFHGVAGVAAAPAPAGGRWSELVSYYSAALEDWMLVSEDNARATAWINSKGYVRQRVEGAWVISAASAPGFGQPMTQYWKAAINDTTLAGSAEVVKELEKQGYIKLWVEGFGVGSVAPPPAPGPGPPPKPKPKPKPGPKFLCFGSPGHKVCAHSKSANASYHDSSCDTKCPPVPVPPRQPHAYEIPAQQFGFAAIPSATNPSEATIMFIGLRFGSAPTKNHDFQYWELLRFDGATGDILPLKWVDSFSLSLPAKSDGL